MLVYEDSNNKLHFGNSSEQGWVWSILNANPITGSGLSLALLSVPWADPQSVGVRLYYEIAPGNLVTNEWNDPPQDVAAGK